MPNEPKAAPMTGAATSNEKSRQGRGPGYPFIAIDKALVRAEELKKREGFYAVPREAVFRAWNFAEKSSGARQTLAALKNFGLVEYVGAGDSAKVKLSDIARRILLDVRPESEERDDLIRQAAFTPPIHMELAREYPNGLPSDTTIQTFLMKDKGFTEPGAKDLIAEYRDTLACLRPVPPANMPSVSTHEAEALLPNRDLAVGDLVQVEIGGALQLDKPKRVRAIQEHQGQMWVFIEGSATGIPMDQVMIESKADVAKNAPPILPDDSAPSARQVFTPKPGMKEEKNSLDEGEAVLIWPENLSADSVLDLEYWLTGIMKKAKRRAGIQDKVEPSGSTASPQTP